MQHETKECAGCTHTFGEYELCSICHKCEKCCLCGWDDDCDLCEGAGMLSINGIMDTPCPNCLADKQSIKY